MKSSLTSLLSNSKGFGNKCVIAFICIVYYAVPSIIQKMKPIYLPRYWWMFPDLESPWLPNVSTCRLWIYDVVSIGDGRVLSESLVVDH